MMTGWKTILFNGLVIAATGALTALAGYNWVEAVGPSWAVVIVAGVNFALRFVTTTPVFGEK